MAAILEIGQKVEVKHLIEVPKNDTWHESIEKKWAVVIKGEVVVIYKTMFSVNGTVKPLFKILYGKSTYMQEREYAMKSTMLEVLIFLTQLNKKENYEK